MEIEREKKQLKKVLSHLEERLEDLHTLVLDIISYHLDYSVESIKYLELVLKNLPEKARKDQELIKDVGLYMGETIQRNYHGKWDIFNLPESNNHLQPCIKFSNTSTVIFPFLEAKEFMKTPTVGFFEMKLNF